MEPNTLPTTLWDNIWYLLTTALIGGVTLVWRKVTGNDNRISALELDIAKNYATNVNVDKLEAKMDAQHTLINSKLDNINNNIINLFKGNTNGSGA